MTQNIDLAKKFCDFFIALNGTLNLDSYDEFGSLGQTASAQIEKISQEDSKSFQSTLKSCVSYVAQQAREIKYISVQFCLVVRRST